MKNVLIHFNLTQKHLKSGTRTKQLLMKRFKWEINNRMNRHKDKSQAKRHLFLSIGATVTALY